MPKQIRASWIWRKQHDLNAFNQTVVARRSFNLKAVGRALAAVTADSYYRLAINGRWVADGPCRSWPEHFQYDEIDVSSYLVAGENTIEIVARYFGEGTFHQVPRQAGLFFQLDCEVGAKSRTVLVSDGEWQVAQAKAWKVNTPTMSIQNDPTEIYDANAETLRFTPAMVIGKADGGPWGDLNPRDVALLGREPRTIESFCDAQVVDANWMAVSLSTVRLLHPGVVEANANVSESSVLATVIVSPKAQTIKIDGGPTALYVNGKKVSARGAKLNKGRNFLLAPVRPILGHQKDCTIRFIDTEGFTLSNPLDPEFSNPWCFAPVGGELWCDDDLHWHSHAYPARDEYVARIEKEYKRLARVVTDEASFAQELGGSVKQLKAGEMFMPDPHQQFMARRPLASAAALVENPTGLRYDNSEYTLVQPSPKGDIELMYDLGEQSIGFYEFELEAAEGTVVDIFGIEFIAPSGALQHTVGCRNGLRYTCKEGTNRFTSIRRRSGRYLYLTLRAMSGPVAIRNLRVIESTYPVEPIGSFRCSDPQLERVWQISQRTLQLCMEDTFTDCPLYEQTLWVGDARNESLFAYTAFGATDIARRCITLAGQSLERYPLVGCQLPSAWDCVLPAWSFMWGISVWDYYFYSGDKKFLRSVWKWVTKNLRNTEKRCTDRGLFSMTAWNLFDWSGADDGHETVVHNSMFVVGAIDAALNCAKVLGDTRNAAWLRRFRKQQVEALRACWDDKKHAWPDAFLADGSASKKTCIHTSFLALLYDVVDEEHYNHALNNVLDTPEGMTPIGSPFAIQYLYEALEKVGQPNAVLNSIYKNYLPMLRADATTVWEVFPGSPFSIGEFPTRSHCHAWSSAPIHFLNRIILGIVQTGVGGSAYTISPRVTDHQWAEGASATVQGPVKVRWEKNGKTLAITAEAQTGVKLKYVANETHHGLNVVFNGRKLGKK